MSRPDDLVAFEERWAMRGVDAYVYSDTRGREPVIHLAHLRVPASERRRGLGSAFMEDLSAYADRHGQTITLSTASAERGETTSAARLRRFYGRFGFVRNFGRRADYALSGTMYRRPRGRARVRRARRP